jgi:hypothetical protein
LKKLRVRRIQELFNEKVFYILTLVVLIISNILSITWGTFNAVLSTAFATVSGIGQLHQLCHLIASELPVIII